MWCRDWSRDCLADKGVPEFWLTVLMKCDTTAELIKEKDVNVLTYLTNITVSTLLHTYLALTPC